MVTEADL